MENGKKKFSDFFYDFPAAGNIEKKIKYIYIYIYTNYDEKTKKNFSAENLEWATAHLYCKKNIVLQLSEK